MHIHYFILRKIAAHLAAVAKDGVFGTAFTQEKDQIVIGLGTPGGDIWLRVCCGAPLPFVWPMSQYNKARKNVKLLFEQLDGMRIARVQAVPYERVILIDLEQGYQVALKMHGLQSNVLLLRHGQVVDRFRQHSDADLAFVPVPGEWHADAIADPALAEAPAAARLKAISPVLEKNCLAFVEGEMAQGRSFEEAFAALMAHVEADRYYLVRRPDRMQLLLFPPAAGAHAVREGLLPALHTFFKTWHQYQGYARVFEEVRKPLEGHLKRLGGQIDSFYTSIDAIAHERPPEELGHLLMANLHRVEQGSTEVTLEDFYGSGTVQVRLKPELNAQQNAEQYYQKQKKHRSRVKHLEEQIMRLEAERDALQAVAAKFAAFPAPADLEVGEEGIDYDLLRRLNAFGAEFLPMVQSGKAESAAQKHGFIEYGKDGYTILVGKNAKQNDALTFAYSKKDDLWLHARDTPGSHVIVRNPTAGLIPNRVLEHAARIAALHSKRKHESLVPVQYTERKYVRKVKNGAPGQVLVDREKVVMVEPLQP